MVIGNDDIDELDDLYDVQVDQQPTGDPTPSSDVNDQDDFIDQLLKQRGIEDKSKIKFEEEEGNVQEKSWDDLSNEEKFNILNTSTYTPNEDSELDESELQLINQMRESGLTPSEYLENIQKESVDTYLKNNSQETYQYEVDQYDDDELFIYDFITRMEGNVTDEEAQEALERAKQNETLFAKQIGAIRNEYKAIEQENIQQAQIEREQEAQENYDKFADSVAEQIVNFDDYHGYNLNMDDDDRQMLYDFITGVDGAGNNYFVKALRDPKVLVNTAWFALNGEQILDDITNYFQEQIKQVRKQSYEKGIADAKKSDTQVVYRNKEVNVDDSYNDLDDF